jgi:putative flippase GtrA
MINKFVNFVASVSHFILRKIGLNYSRSGLEQFFRYFVSGIIATLTDFIIIYALTDGFGLWYLYSGIISFICALSVSYVLNRFWTFNNKDRRFGRQLTIFLIVAIIGLLINNGLMVIGVEILGLWYIFAKAIATIIALIWNFLGQKYFTFR